jgi:hypothetical protein
MSGTRLARLRLFIRENFVLRALQLQPVWRQFEFAEQNHALMRLEDVVQKRLVEPDCANRPRAIAKQQLEDLEARATGGPDAARDDFAEYRGGNAGAQRRDRLKVSAILVADRKAIQQVFDGMESDALEIGGAARANALEVLKGRLQCVYWTTNASPFPTRISLILAGSSKGSSMPMPDGFSADLE